MLGTGFTIVARLRSVEICPYSQQRECAARLLSAMQAELLTVLMIGRLHYRTDPLDRVRGRVAERTWLECQTNDAALAWACYRIEGIEGLCRLEGDFVIACYDQSTEQLVTLRDPMGNYPLFWTQHGGTIALSTSIRPLADLVPDLALDTEYAADYLVFPYDIGAELPLQHTAYRGIRRLMPGWLWEADLARQHVVCRRYWRWPDKIVPVAVSSVAEAGALVRDSLEAAVRERLSRRAHTASHFSGGFDSTGIALLASRLSSTPLHAVSLVYQSPRLAGETEYIQAALARNAAITWHPIPADDLLDYEAYERLPPLDEPSVCGARWNTFAVLARAAAEAGADTLLSGDGGDALFSNAPSSHVVELLSMGQLRRAWRLACRYSYTSGTSAHRILIEALRLFVPRRVRDGVGPLLHGGRTSFEAMTERAIPSWLTEDFVRRHRLRRRVLELQIPVTRSRFLTADALAFSAGDWLTWYAGLPHGVTMSRPYYDPRLLTLGLALPRSLHAEAGPMKPVLASALHDVLPEKILMRSRKVHFGIFMYGMTLRQKELEAIIRETPVPEGMLHRSVLLDALAKAVLGIYPDQWGVARLQMALSYLMWLSTRETWRKVAVPTITLQQVCHGAQSR
jgi:asparagine synthase (glutamine-hydrolysing)